MKGKETCHHIAHTLEGLDIIRKKIGDELYFALDKLSRQTIQDHCFMLAITKNEFKLEKRKELEDVLKEHRRFQH